MYVSLALKKIINIIERFQKSFFQECVFQYVLEIDVARCEVEVVYMNKGKQILYTGMYAGPLLSTKPVNFQNTKLKIWIGI